MALRVACGRRDHAWFDGAAAAPVGAVLVAMMVAMLASCSSAGTAPVDGASGGDTTTTEPAGPVDVAVDGTLPLADRALDDPDVTTVASDLAPSQIVAATVPQPPTPPPCAPSDVELWTARTEAAGLTVDAVIRVRNVGDDWCEPDIGRSPLFDPAIEPDVWLWPGDLADLRVGQMSADCADPSLVTLIQVGIGTESVVVPSAVLTCGWWLDAFVPVGPVAEACTSDGLETAVTDLAVVVRTTTGPCMLGDVVAVEGGDGVDPVAERPAVQPAFDVLFPGDVARIGAASGVTCDTQARSVTLRLEGGGDVDLDEVPCDMRFWTGSAAPWFGSESGPTVGLEPGPSAMDEFDPFA